MSHQHNKPSAAPASASSVEATKPQGVISNDNAGEGSTSEPSAAPAVHEEETWKAPTPPHKLPIAERPQIKRKPGEVLAGDFIVLRDGNWHYCPDPSDVRLSRRESAISVALEGFGYDPATGALNQQVKNIAVAQFWQDASKSPFRHSRKEVADALKLFGVDIETIRATIARMPQEVVPDPLA